jgi:hypothetical protein
MRYKLVFMVGVGIGFVLGARAGRERYEQLRKLARKAAESPATQQAVAAFQAQAVGAAKTVGGKLADRAGTARAKVGEALHDRVPGMRTRDANGHASGNGRDGYAPTPGAPGDPRQS